jgi:N-acetyl-anhydromuramyl-L-alanine amidase AmpD
VSKRLCALSCIAGFWLLLCIGCGGQSPIPAEKDSSTTTEQKTDPVPLDLSHDSVDPATLKAAPDWQQPLNPAFQAAAAAYEVPVDLLVTLGKVGSGIENRGSVATIEGGYGVMALRDNETGGESLDLAAQLTGATRKQLISDPVASINGAAAVLNAYAVEAGVDRATGIEAWLPAVIKYAGLDDEDSKFFAMGVYELINIGIDYTNSYDERFIVVPRALETINLQDLVPPGVKKISLEDLAAGKNPDEIGPAPKGKDDTRNVDYPGATWDPAASCNYTATSSSKDTVIVHTAEGSAAGTRSWFKNCAAQVSSQYVVSEAGGVWQCVVESYKAWHVGCLNSRSVGIEHEGYASSSSHPVALYNASALLTRNICDRRGIPKAHNGCPPGVLGHIDANNCVCGPGHTDPGAGWDWGYYISQINGGVALDSAYNNQSYTASMVAGSTAVVWVEYKNTGTTTWTRGGANGVNLGTWNPQDRSSAFYTAGNWLGANRPTDMDVASCAPGSVCRFSFVMTAPSTPGTYTEYWRLVKEGVAWFGYTGVYFQITVTAPQDNAAYVSDTIPATMTPGQVATVNITFSNNGGTTWTKANAYKLGAIGDSDPFAGGRQDLADADSIAPGQQKTFAIHYTAPTTPGTYTTDWQMLRENVHWFGGTLSKNVTVTATPPTITQQPAAATVCAGGTATFTVAASGSSLSYQWQKNSVNVANGGHYSGATTATLTVTGADANDAANYRCVVTNSGGNATSNQAALTVRAATAITQQPAAQTVCAGGTATFAVTATGDGTLIYQWQKNGTNITGATGATLQINSVVAGDAANYCCVVTGGCGVVTSNNAALTVNAVTAITAQPQPASVPALGTATFSVTATGTSLTYQWQKNSVNLANGGNIAGVTTATLTISSVTSADAASYRCVVTGTCGSVTSNTAALTVTAILADNFESYGSQAAFEGVWTDTANSAYILSTTGGNPGAQLSMPSPSANSLGRYYRSLGAKYTGTAASPLVISFDFYLDAAGAPNWTGARHTVDLRGYSGTTYGSGTLENLVSAGVNNNSSDTFSTTRYQGRVTNGSEWQTLDEGSAPSRAAGWHQLKIQVSNSQVLFYVDGILSETESRPNSYGFDWVVLGSDLTAAGFAAGVDNLVVSGGVALPSFTQQPTAQTICAGGSVNFAVAASGTGTLTYKWQKNGVDLADGGHVSGADTATLQISSTDSTDAASYRCKVTNADGVVTSNAATLTIQSTSITQQPAAQAPCVGGTATFTVAATGQAPLSYQWRKDGGNLAGATAATLTLTGVTAADVGSYTCVVTDGCSNGVTSSAAALTMNAAPAISGTKPVAMTVLKNSTCGTANQVALSATDADTAAGSLGWSITTAAAHGTASFVGSNTGGSVTLCYVPVMDQFAADSFVVSVSDGCGGSDTVTVNVTVQTLPNVLVDNFDNYANQAAFDAVWYDTNASPYYFDATSGNPNGTVIMPSPSANAMGRFYRNFGGSFNGTDAAPLTLTYDLYLDAAGAPGWSGARHFVEIRGYSGAAYNSGSLQNLLAIGLNNGSSDTFSTTKYQGRVLNGAAWQTLDEGSAPARAAGWHQMKIVVTTGQVLFYVDNILSETETRPNSYGFDCVMIGSDLTAAGFTVRVDNLAVTCGQ